MYLPTYINVGTNLVHTSIDVRYMDNYVAGFASPYGSGG